MSLSKHSYAQEALNYHVFMQAKKIFTHEIVLVRGLFIVFWDTGYSPIFILGYGLLTLFFLGYGIFRNFGIWDIGIYFGIRVKLVLGYGIFWTVYFGI